MGTSTVKLNGTTLLSIDDTTATASDVASGKYFYTADGTKTEGTASGGDNSKYLNLIAKTGTSFSDDSVTEIGRNIFAYWTTLETISLPNLVKITDGVFQGSNKISNFYFPKVTTITNGNNFNGAGTSTSTIVLPSVSSIPSMNAFNTFKGKAIDLDGSLSNLNTYTFNSSSELETIILRKNSVVAVNHVNAFNSTPFASDGTGGILYVPESLVSSYQSATNWSTILGYTNNQIKSIESTHTDPNASIDLTLYYADGTPIPSN